MSEQPDCIDLPDDEDKLYRYWEAIYFIMNTLGCSRATAREILAKVEPVIFQ